MARGVGWGEPFFAVLASYRGVNPTTTVGFKLQTWDHGTGKTTHNRLLLAGSSTPLGPALVGLERPGESKPTARVAFCSHLYL